MIWLALWACRVELGPPDPPAATSEGPPAGEVWIYTSMYPSVIDAVDPQIRALYPELDPKWYPAGSEKVAQRIDAEWSAGGSKACLVLTSDPFWYVAHADRLQPHLPPNVLHVPRDLVDLDGRWVTARISLMVMAAGSQADRPASFRDLADPRFANRVTMPDPLASGTAFTTIASWSPELTSAVLANGTVAAGGSAAVLNRLERGEKDVGVLLLENLLAARRKGSLVEPVFPTDGAVAIPGPIALTADCPNPSGARAVYDFLLSPAGQQAMIDGDMYAAIPDLPPPAGAPALDTITVRPWSDGFADRVAREQAAIKARWADLVSR